MCGFAGFLKPSGLGEEAENHLRAMSGAIAHRGPDDEGFWLDPKSGIALSHRRLSIIDLSPAGHQPMLSQDGRYVIVFNGEIYNYLEIKKELEAVGAAPAWRGHSDTEVLLAAFAQWGVTETVKRCVGMFAFALWDVATRTLSLARDRMGEKPLYYGWHKDLFLFGSDLASFKANPSFQGEFDRNALTLMMRHNCIPAPYSIYKGIHKLRPGHVAILHENKKEPDITAYWCLSDVADAGAKNPFRGSVDEAMEEVERLLLNAVRGQMMADVPLGCFLSGGVDSSLTTALMQSLSDKPIKTFSIGFEEEAYNEAPYARAVATHLGTDHEEMIVTEQQARDVVPKLPQIYSEPFSDSSQIPTYLVSQLARSKVTVSLSGDAGDELFSGYRRYQLGDGLWQKLEMFPEGARHMAAKALQSVSPDLWNSAVPRFLCRENAGDKIHKVADIIDSPSGNELYRRLVSHWRNPEKLVLGGKEPPTMLTGLDAVPLMPNFVQRMMLLDQQSYLPDDILVKLDRAGMGVALESRVPMLDHRLIEFTWRLPLSVLRHGGKSKAPLRAVLYKHVPCNLIERPKVGFGVPLDRWLRGSLRDWAEDLLSEKRLREDGFFNAAMVRAVWAEHLSGRYNRAYWLWDILMFQAFVGGRGSFSKC